MTLAKKMMRFASPALCGIKPANLFSISACDFAAERGKLAVWSKTLSVLGRRFSLIKRTDCLFLVFVYDESMLEMTIYGKDELRYLIKKGYPVAEGLDAVLAELFFRLRQVPAFPHEIGLFLGYPLEDVVAFEKDGGKQSKYTGFWQVYGNVDKACEKMRQYRECSARCCSLLDEGMDVPAVCKRFLRTKLN